MAKKYQIGVVGSSGGNISGSAVLPEEILKVAYEVGEEIAKSGHVLVCGGRDGVMESACKGAREQGGLTVGILPSKDGRDACAYLDVRIPTGLGWLRNGPNVYASDGLIVIAGGVGTLSELCFAYMERKPIVSIKTTGGVATEFADRYLDDRKS